MMVGTSGLQLVHQRDTQWLFRELTPQVLIPLTFAAACEEGTTGPHRRTR